MVDTLGSTGLRSDRFESSETVTIDSDLTDAGDVIDTAWRGLDADADLTLGDGAVRSVRSDADGLCELFESLFRTAVEHAGEDGTVRVGPLAAGFYVEDDGHGYGLSVARRVVGARDWDIVATDAQTGGARFEITRVEREPTTDGDAK